MKCREVCFFFYCHCTSPKFPAKTDMTQFHTFSCLRCAGHTDFGSSGGAFTPASAALGESHIINIHQDPLRDGREVNGSCSRAGLNFCSDSGHRPQHGVSLKMMGNATPSSNCALNFQPVAAISVTASAQSFGAQSKLERTLCLYPCLQS